MKKNGQRRTPAPGTKYSYICHHQPSLLSVSYTHLLRYAFDNDYTSRWHSNWKGATDKLTGSNSFYAEINFGQKYTINQFSFTPRTDTASGYVTKADLYIKANDSDEWTLVAQDQTFAADATQKTFTFDAQEVQYVKFVAKASSDGWVAVSEFDIANTAQNPDRCV